MCAAHPPLVGQVSPRPGGLQASAQGQEQGQGQVACPTRAVPLQWGRPPPARQQMQGARAPRGPCTTSPMTVRRALHVCLQAGTEVLRSPCVVRPLTTTWKAMSSLAPATCTHMYPPAWGHAGRESVVVVRDADGLLSMPVISHQEQVLTRAMEELCGQVGGPQGVWACADEATEPGKGQCPALPSRHLPCNKPRAAGHKRHAPHSWPAGGGCVR